MYIFNTLMITPQICKYNFTSILLAKRAVVSAVNVTVHFECV